MHSAACRNGRVGEREKRRTGPRNRHLAVLRLRQRDGLPKDGEFMLPLGPVIPLLSCAVVGWLLLQVPPDEAGEQCRECIGHLAMH